MATSQTYPGLYGNDYLKWLFIVVSLFAMYLPTFYNLSGRLWQSDDHAHGPFVLLIALFLFWQKRAVLLTNKEVENQPLPRCVFMY